MSDRTLSSLTYAGVALGIAAVIGFVVVYLYGVPHASLVGTLYFVLLLAAVGVGAIASGRVVGDVLGRAWPEDSKCTDTSEGSDAKSGYVNTCLEPMVLNGKGGAGNTYLLKCSLPKAHWGNHFAYIQTNGYWRVKAHWRPGPTTPNGDRTSEEKAGRRTASNSTGIGGVGVRG